MKKALIAGTAALLALAACAIIAFPRLAPHPVIPSKEVAERVRDGDIICRLGDRLWSLYFKDVSPTDKRFSHLGIARVTGGAVTVINAEGRAMEGRDFVNETGLEEFLGAARAAGIYRPRGLDGKALSTAAAGFIGVPFDWSFDLQDDTRLYCTELLYAALKKAAPEIRLQTVFRKELNRELIPLEAVSNSPYFEEVAYIGNRK